MTLAALDITFDPSDRAEPWRFAPVAGPDPARCVIGRTPEEAERLLPRVFNLCGGAHGAAAAAALGRDAGPDAVAARLAVARQERIRDHALAVLHDWPTLFGLEPDRAALGRIGGGAADRRALAQHLASGDPDLAAASAADLDAWIDEGASPAARVLARLRQAAEPLIGRAELPSPTRTDFAAALHDGAPPMPRETTILDGWREAPLVAALLAREGASLVTRFVARLLDLLAGLIDAPDPAPVPAASPGLGRAWAARGLLAHQARVENGVVTAYHVLSPSAWNLAPGGLLTRVLTALPIGPNTPMLARIAIASVNPCVPVRLRVETPEGALHA
ncbi:nickel-dependent hydrogenase large subunit [Segnochrobactrum spirostomi]|uniref:Hydrogenase expression/formation protein HupK n=1 Tax=Segnochrobactrum spirostomi TaxID=2608987 RepID=A0A6A7YAK4_9HYPH|nr:nickel-dependent hydrogenase large subunit [Segnochrobactrum spirostomi]MQT15357.1 hypothetical protein [Segnochrobactrum spirostomi]